MSRADTMNQTPPLAGSNAWRDDPLLVQISEDCPASVRDSLDQLGRYVRSAEAQDLARLANRHEPVLHAYDRYGERVDRIEFHPAYHALMRRSVSEGLHCSIWDDTGEEMPVRATARALRFYLMAQLETGHLCPITMTNASLAALATEPPLFASWSSRVRSRRYDSSNKAPVQKAGLTLGMGMTERQGGTDVRANETTAESIGEGYYSIRGHKWFLSAPASDAFLVLAQVENAGPTCFLVQRRKGDGSDNGLRFQRLKDKLGNRSNASSEVLFEGTIGQRVGGEGRGIRTIMDMVTLTRLDCAVASSGLMRAGLSEAVHHARHRSVFDEKLIDQPLMERVLADMSLDVAAASALSFRLARAFDNAGEDDGQAAYLRLMTPVVKYWTCKIAPALLYEAMECLGGNGYVEDFPLARYYREAPVNAIWEGSGNVMALDVMRVLQRSPETLETVLETLAEDLGPNSASTLDVVRAAGRVAATDPGSARILTEQLALSAAGAELRAIGAGRIADAFIETRLAGQWRTSYGMLDARRDPRMLLETLYPSYED